MTTDAAPCLPDCDLVIRGATLLDGSGGPPFVGDVLVQSGRIVCVGSCSGVHARREIDAAGLYACPGFIDPHGHSDLTLLADPRGLSKLAQGITTEASGQCGMSPFPVPADDFDEFRALLSYLWAPVDLTWRDARGYLAEMDGRALGLNLCPFAGANTAVLGHSPDVPGLAPLASALRESMADLWGLSLGLAYEPLLSWPAESLRALVAAAAGKTVGVHMRNERAGLFDSIEETLALVRDLPVRLEIAHLKCTSEANWGRIAEAVAMIEDARRGGLDVAFNVYPYTATSTFLAATLPAWLSGEGHDRALRLLREPEVRERLREDHLAGRTFVTLPPDRILIASVDADDYRWTEGHSLADIATHSGRHPFDVAVDMLLAARGQVNAVFFALSEDDMRLVLAHPLASVTTDGLAVCPDGPTSRGKPHPRGYGAFARFLGRYVRDEGLVDWPEAIRKCTSWPASRLGLHDRGLLRPGYAADITVFDPATVADAATYEDPHRLAVGVHYVLVGGVLSIDSGAFTGDLGGSVLSPRAEQLLVAEQRPPTGDLRVSS
jgi:N-acyl-D-amino-acid deacylase